MAERFDRPIRVGLIHTREQGGGAESCVRLLRDGLIRRGHEVTLWVGREPVRGPNTRVIPTRAEDRMSADRYARKGFFSLGLTASKRFSQSDEISNLDLVHFHNIHGHYFSLDAMPLVARKVPIVWTFHDFFPFTGGCAFPFACERWRERCGSCPQLGRYPIVTPFDRTRRMLSIKRRLFGDLTLTIITPSRHLGEAGRESGMFPRAEWRIVPYAVDLETFHPQRAAARKTLGIEPDASVVMLAAQGLDDPRKGIDHAVGALADLRKRRLTVLLAGGGDAATGRGRLSGHDVRELGYIADRARLAACLSAADVFVFPSLAENFPCIVQEAMACGTAVVAFSIPGTDEQIRDGETGFLVPSGDTGALRAKLEAVLGDRERLREVGLRARQHAEREWKLDRFLSRHEAIYRSRIEADSPAVSFR